MGAAALLPPVLDVEMVSREAAKARNICGDLAPLWAGRPDDRREKLPSGLPLFPLSSQPIPHCFHALMR